MAVDTIQKATLTLKETGEASLFSFFTNAKWLNSLNGGIGHFILMPFLGFAFAFNAILEWYKFYKAKNKNLEKTVGLIATTLSAIAAVASVSGTIGGELLGFSFAAGPWLFIASLGVGISHQLVMLAVNLLRAFQAPNGSAARKGFVQASINNVFSLALLGAITAAVIVVMISPVGPVAMAVIAATAATLTVVNLTWRLVKHFKPGWIRAIKDVLGLEKSTIDYNKQVNPTALAQEKSLSHKYLDDKVVLLDTKRELVHGSLFKPVYYQHQTALRIAHNENGIENAREYLLTIIEAKLEDYESSTDGKSKNKELTLNDLKEVLAEKKTIAEVSISGKALQSFFAQKGEVEQLVEAVNYWDEKRSELQDRLKKKV